MPSHGSFPYGLNPSRDDAPCRAGRERGRGWGVLLCYNCTASCILIQFCYILTCCYIGNELSIELVASAVESVVVVVVVVVVVDSVH